MKRWMMVARATAMAAAATVLGGCPEECDPITREVTDPSLGERTGRLTWLQTGAETTLSLRTAAPRTSETTNCNPGAEVSYALASGDGVIDVSGQIFERLEPDGTFESTEISLVVAPEDVLAAGVAPEMPGLAERDPRLTLVVSRVGDGFGQGELRAVTSTDDVALATVDFGAAP